MYARIAIVLLAPMMLVLTGCADRRMVRTEMVQTPSTIYYPATVAQHDTAVSIPAGTVVEKRTTVHTEEIDEDEPRGLLSTTVHFVGEIIALPFRLVGGLIRAIF